MNKKNIDLVILAGGKGTRIKKYLKGYPKPMLKFNKKYFLTYILNLTSKYNFNKIFILTGYRSKIIFKNFHNKSFNLIKVKCLKENDEMGTAGALSLLKGKVNDFVLFVKSIISVLEEFSFSINVVFSLVNDFVLFNTFRDSVSINDCTSCIKCVVNSLYFLNKLSIITNKY